MDLTQRSLPFREKISFLAGGVGKDMACGIIYGFYIFYLTAIIGLDPLIIGVAFFLSRLFDAINDPFMGFIVDNTRTKFGKFRPWIAIGTIATSIAIVLMFLKVDMPKSMQYVYYIGLYVVWSVAYTLMDVPYWAMLPVLAKTPHERNSLATWTRLATGLGGTIVNTLAPILIIAFYQTQFNAKAYVGVSIFVAVSFIVTIFFTVINTKEKIDLKSPKLKFSDLKMVVTKNDQLVAFFFIIAFFLSGTGISGAFNIYYFSYDLGLFNVMGIYVVATGLIPTISMIFFPHIAKIISRRKIFIISICLGMSGFLGMFLMGTFFGGNLILLGIFNVLVGICTSMVSLLMTLMLADTVDYGELKFAHRTDSIVFSLQPFLYKFSSAVSALVLGAGLKIARIPEIGDATVEEFEIIKAGISSNAFVMIRVLMFGVPIFFLFVALLIYIKKFKLNDEFLEKVTEDLIKMRKQIESKLEDSD